MSTSGKKRKADAISTEVHPDGGPDRKACGGTKSKQSGEVNCMDLPLSIWGKILDHLPFADVRSARLLSRTVAFQAIKNVRKIHVLKSAELNVKFGKKRLTHVRHVNIFCFIELLPPKNVTSNQRLNVEAAGRIVPFLMCIPNLEHVVLAGLGTSADDLLPVPTENRSHYQYTSRLSVGDRDDNELAFKSLLLSLAGAFASGALSQSIALEGAIGCMKKYQCHHRANSEECTLCKTILYNFPLNSLIFATGVMDGYRLSDFCLSEEKVCSVIKQRQWSDDCIKAASKHVLSTFFNGLVRLSKFNASNVISLGAHTQSASKDLFFIPEKNLQRLRILRELGCRACPFVKRRTVWADKDSFLSVLFTITPVLNDLPKGRCMINKKSFDELVALGYQIEELDKFDVIADNLAIEEEISALAGAEMVSEVVDLLGFTL